MDANSAYELYLIKNELQSIINELNNIAFEISKDFSNIGENQVSACIYNVAEKYKVVKRKLDNIDTEKVTDEYAASHTVQGGGNGGGGGHAF